MPTAVAQRLQAHFAPWHEQIVSDVELLSRFVHSQDESAFSVLVERHGPMVAGLCQRRLQHTQDAEDAFQATFLVFAKKAAQALSTGAVAGWLYGAANKACQEVIRRRVRKPWQSLVDEVPAGEMVSQDGDRVTAVLEAVGRLPIGQRDAVILCELEGVSRAQASRQLGIPEGTLSSRLALARKRLQQILRPHSVTPIIAIGLLATPVAFAFDPSLVTPFARQLAEALMPKLLISWQSLCLVATLFLGSVGLTFAASDSPPAKPPTPVAIAKPTPVPAPEPKLRVMAMSILPGENPKSLIDVYVLNSKTGFEIEKRFEFGGKGDEHLRMPVGSQPVSPDGKWWVHMQFRNKRADGVLLPSLCVAPFEQCRETTYVFAEENLVPLGWSADSRVLYLREIKHPSPRLLGITKYRVWKFDVATKERSALLGEKEPTWTESQPIAVSPVTAEIISIKEQSLNILHSKQRLQWHSPRGAAQDISTDYHDSISTYADISPDGQHIIYSLDKFNWKPNSSSLYFLQPYLDKIGDKDPRVLALNSPTQSQGSSQFAWSPDSQRLAAMETLTKIIENRSTQQSEVTIFDIKGNKQAAYPLPAHSERGSGMYMLSFAGWR
jgi:RNA polymerase sigma factor (sigma-70 family)